MEAAITEITLEPSLSACIMKQKGEGEVGLVWRAGLPVGQARHFATGLAIWLANLLVSIRVQTTLLELNVSRSWSRFEKSEKSFFLTLILW